MYFSYNIETIGNKTKFQRLSQISLAGNRSGIIVRYLRKMLSKSDTEPYSWNIQIDKLIKRLNLKGNSIVIDAKPNSDKYLSLFNIINIWGYSSFGWTPILFELKEILSDEDPRKFNRSDFTITNYNAGQSIFTFLYLQGSIKGGEIENTWSFPGPSPTNSVLLWPEALKFFVDKMG